MDNRKLKLKSLNCHITCYICKGYLIDATTVTECLHTFCKSCIVKYLEETNTCPRCEVLIHQSHPLQYICADRTMQDIVYKLVPNLLEEETNRRKLFCMKYSIKLEIQPNCSDDQNNPPLVSPSASNSGDFHRSDEQIDLSLQCGSGLKKIRRRFIRCSSQATVTHLKKYVSQKIFADLIRFCEVDIFCNDVLMGKDYSMNFISKTVGRNKIPPLELIYRKHIEL